MAEIIKDKKIQVYYSESFKDGKNEIFKRHFIHCQNYNGLWAAVRDLMRSEIVTNQTIDINSNILFVVNWNPVIIEKWSSLWIIFKGKTFKIVGKPDEFNYRREDLKINALAQIDNKHKYAGDIYEQY